MINRLDRKGFIKLFFTFIVLAALAIVLVTFGKPYYRYYTLRSYTNDELLIEVGNVNTIRQKVLERAKELGVPLDPGDLEVTGDQRKVTVRAKWSEDVDFWGYYTKRLDFTLDEAY